MLKTVVILPDGSLLSSGTPGQHAIKSCSLTRCVNADRELTLGSVCAAMAELNILTAGDDLPLQAGEEFTLLRQDGENAYLVGIFIAQKPEKTSASALKLTAYDRVSLLDRDLTQWLEGLTQWPYTLQQLSQMVSQACGLTLKPGQLPNGEYPVAKFYGQGVTGRQLMGWIGELAGRFCRCCPDGELEFAWYTPKAVEVGKGDLFFYQKGLTYADYTTAPIQRVQLRQNEGDVGTCYPDGAENANTYIISGNPLASAGNAGSLIGIAQTLYEQLEHVTYTPCKLTIPASFQVDAGDILTFQAPDGNTLTAYIMSRRQQGDKDVLECTGSQNRSETVGVSSSYRNLAGKVMNLTATVDGLQAENKSADGKMAALALDIAGITAEVSQQSAKLDGMTQQMTVLEQKADGVEIRVKTLTEQGATKVTTETGFTFDEQGLTIAKAGSGIENLLNESGMYVKRASQVLLQADQTGVQAVDVSVGNFLVVGDHARFEDYENSRTACFWI